MEQASMTALISAFSRAYHAEHNAAPIFCDRVARRLFSDQEYSQISQTMSRGIHFFCPSFSGSPDKALRIVVDGHLSPSPLGRAAFAEAALATAVGSGAKQYLLFAAGYDSFSYRQPDWAAKLQIFELDHPIMSLDKQARLGRAGLPVPQNVHYVQTDFTSASWAASLQNTSAFDASALSFCSALGLVYYLSKPTFASFLSVLKNNLPKGSTLVFDYPDTFHANENKQALLAKEAKEEMVAGYTYEEMEALLSKYEFLIYEHLTPEEMTNQYFRKYNNANPAYPMAACKHVNYCLCVKQ